MSARPSGAADVAMQPLTPWQLRRQVELQMGPDALRAVREDVQNQQSYTLPQKNSVFDFRSNAQPFYDPNKAVLATGILAAAIATAPEGGVTWPVLGKVATSLGLITLLPLAAGAKPVSRLTNIPLPEVIADCVIDGKKKVTLTADPLLTSSGTFNAVDIAIKAAPVSQPIYRGDDRNAYVINISNDPDVVDDLHYTGFDKDIPADPKATPRFEGKTFVLSIPRNEQGNLFPAKARLLTKEGPKGKRAL
jgi:hypothetical protein